MNYNRQLALVVKEKDQVLTAREETTRGEPLSARRAWVLGTAIALVALTVGSVFGDRGILNLLRRREQVETLRGELESRCGRVRARSSGSRGSSSGSRDPTRRCSCCERSSRLPPSACTTARTPLSRADEMRFALDRRARNAFILARVSLQYMNAAVPSQPEPVED
jgi:hypothetical protein